MEAAHFFFLAAFVPKTIGTALHAKLKKEMPGIAEDIRNRVLEAKTNPQKSASAAFSPADELIKYKALLDSGVLTQEEFDAKKNQLLGL